MEHFPIMISHYKQVHHFQVSEYPHHDGERCKYKVFHEGTLVASFAPDAQNYLHICQNVAGLQEELLYKLADQIESKMPHAESRHLNNEEKNL